MISRFLLFLFLKNKNKLFKNYTINNKNYDKKNNNDNINKFNNIHSNLLLHKF